MLTADGLHGHIRSNTLKSIALLIGFAVLIAAYWWATCVAWSGIASFFEAASAHQTAGEVYDRIIAAANHRAIAGWMVPVGVTSLWFACAWLFYKSLIRKATGAHPVSRRDEPMLYNTVERVAIAAGLPMPMVEIIESRALNAYASGLGVDDATIAVTRGLLARLEARELEAVIAHEMVHIKNRDVRLMVVALIFAGGLSLAGSLAAHLLSGSRRNSAWSVGDFDTGSSSDRSYHRSGGVGAGGSGALIGVGAALLVAAATLAMTQIGAVMTRLAISRSREFMADAGAVELTKDADALISALGKISGRDHVPTATTEMAALMISNGFDEDDFVEALFSTHPPIAARIEALQRHAGGQLPAPARPARRHFRSMASPSTGRLRGP